MQSRLSRYTSTLFTDRVKIPQHAVMTKMLNIAEPTIVPMPIPPSEMNVPTQLMHSSGMDVAIVINVPEASSCFIFNSVYVDINGNLVKVIIKTAVLKVQFEKIHTSFL